MIRLVQVGPLTDPTILDRLALPIQETFHLECSVSPWHLDPGFAYDAKRNQHYSTAIVKLLADFGQRTLGITAVDLYVPVLTFVFGEAQLGGPAALASLCRLQEEFYGLPRREDILFDRLVKEAVHELGHTFGLRHCVNWECAMSSSHGIEKVDVKTAQLCDRCRAAVVPGL